MEIWYTQQTYSHPGEVADLFSDDDIEEILGAMLNECKQVGIADTRENAWMLFIDKVRRNLKVFVSVFAFKAIIE